MSSFFDGAFAKADAPFRWSARSKEATRFADASATETHEELGVTVAHAGSGWLCACCTALGPPPEAHALRPVKSAIAAAGCGVARGSGESERLARLLLMTSV